MRTIYIGTLAISISSGAALAKPPASITTGCITFGDGAAPRGAAGQSFDFEPPAFTTGPLSGQAGWTANGIVGWSVTTPHPAGGLQHARGEKNTMGAQGSDRAALSPLVGPFGPGPVSVSLDFSISATGGADYDIVGQAPSQSLLSWRVKLYFSDLDGDTVPGEILILDDVGFGLQFVSTGVEYTPGVYANLRVDLDSASNSIQYSLNNSLIYTGAAGVFAATSVEQVVLLHDNFQNPMERGDFDNVSLVPAPSAIALLCFGGLAAARRRRN